MKLFTYLALLSTFTIAVSSCKKSTLSAVPVNKVPDAAAIGDWKLVQVKGEIDSVATINGVKTTTAMSMSFDSVSNQYTQKLNGSVKFQYPYSLILTFDNTGSDQLIENYTRANAAGVSTPYMFVTNDAWFYTSTNAVDDGIVIKGFSKTAVLGDYRINPSTAPGASVIQSLLTKPYFTDYDIVAGHLVLYVRSQSIGNSDLEQGTSVSNPPTQINVDYTLTFSRTSNVKDYN